MTVEERLDFCRKHVTDKSGNPFSTDGREWVVDIFRALDGYHATPVDPEHLCGECARELGNDKIFDHPDELASTRRKHGDCKGLTPVKIVGVVFAAERRSGKTFTFASYGLSDVFLNEYRRISVLCPALDQAKDGILAQNYWGPIERSKPLRRRCNPAGNTIEVTKNKSRILAVAHSTASISGKGESLVIVEEARDIDPVVAGRLMISVIEEYEWECGKCGFRPGTKKEPRVKTCPQCKAPRSLQIHQGKVVITSNKGLATGDPKKDWFRDLVELLRTSPDPQWYLFDPPSDARLNPDVDRAGTKTALVRVMEKVPGMAAVIRGEATNDSIQPGADFLTDSEIDQVQDRSLGFVQSSQSPSVAFLDTSKTGDLCSLVVWAQDDGTWSRLVCERADMWRPRDFPGGVLHEGIVLPTIDLVMDQFPAIQSLMIDVRGGLRWALELVKVINTSRPYSRRVEVFESKGDVERMIGWQRLWEMTRSGTYRIPYFEAPDIRGIRCDLWRRELHGVEWKVSARTGLRTVVDRNRKDSHAELTESSALCMWRISRFEAARRGLTLAQIEPSLAPPERPTQHTGTTYSIPEPKSSTLASLMGSNLLRGATTKGGWRD